MIHLEGAGFLKHLTGFTVISYLLSILMKVYFLFIYLFFLQYIKHSFSAFYVLTYSDLTILWIRYYY